MKQRRSDLCQRRKRTPGLHTNPLVLNHPAAENEPLILTQVSALMTALQNRSTGKLCTRARWSRLPPKARSPTVASLILTNTVRETGRPHRRPWLAAVAGDGGTALQDEARVAAVLNGCPHQEFGVRQRPGGVLHVAGVWTVHDWDRDNREEEEAELSSPCLSSTGFHCCRNARETYSFHRRGAASSRRGPAGRWGSPIQPGHNLGRTGTWCEPLARAQYGTSSSSRSGSQAGRDRSHSGTPLTTEV